MNENDSSMLLQRYSLRFYVINARRFFFIIFFLKNTYFFPVYSDFYIIDHGFPLYCNTVIKARFKRLPIRMIYNRERIEIILIEKYS